MGSWNSEYDCLKTGLSHQLLGFFFNRVREVLPESAPVTMWTPGLYPKLTMWWSSFCNSGLFQTQNPPASASGVLRLQVHTIMETVSLLSISDLGAYPLAPLPHTIVLRTIPQACAYGHSKCVFLRDLQLWGLGLSGGKSRAYQSHIFDSKLSQGSLLEKSLWEWSPWNHLTMREETARLRGARLTSSQASRLLLNFSWAEHEANANDHIQALLGRRTLSTSR